MSNNIKSAPSVEKRLKAKDFINTGIFFVIFIIIFFVCITVSSMAVVTQPFGVALCSVIAAPVYLLLRAKSPKAGATLLFCALFALIMFATGTGWPMPIAIIVGAAIAELLAFGGKYKSFVMNGIGYAVIMLSSAIGSYMPLLMMKDYYLNVASSNDVNGEFMKKLVAFITGPVLALSFAVTIVAAVLGILLARVMFKKHFVKAGLIKGEM